MKGGITRFWIGNKIGEYLSASLVIVNNLENEVADIIINNQIGLNVSSANPRATATGLIKCLRSSSALVKYMNNSNDLYEKSFNRIKNTKNYIHYLEKLVN